MTGTFIYRAALAALAPVVGAVVALGGLAIGAPGEAIVQGAIVAFGVGLALAILSPLPPSSSTRGDIIACTLILLTAGVLLALVLP